jgi:hypothetical protein
MGKLQVTTTGDARSMSDAAPLVVFLSRVPFIPAFFSMAAVLLGFVQTGRFSALGAEETFPLVALLFTRATNSEAFDPSSPPSRPQIGRKPRNALSPGADGFVARVTGRGTDRRRLRRFCHLTPIVFM